MARNVTLGTLMDRVRRLSDEETATGRFPDFEIKQYIADSYSSYYGLLVQANPLLHSTLATVTGDGSVDYALAADHLNTLGIWRQSANSRVMLDPVDFVKTKHRFSTASGTSVAWSIVGTNLYLLQPPTTGDKFDHIYVSAAADYSSSATSTNIDGVNGWDELIVYDSAIKILHKNRDPAANQFRSERDRIEARIREMAVVRELVPRDVSNLRADRIRAELTRGVVPIGNGGTLE